ncbi:MAG: TRAP transporter large permease, partial [Pseudomonadales bacterium]
MIGLGPIAIGFTIMLGLMFLGFPVAVSMFAIASLGAALFTGLPSVLSFGNLMWGTLENFILVAIPLYILLGEILLRSGATERMYTALSYWLYKLPGGLLHTNIAASATFAAMSGSSVATAATIGTVALPAFRARGYNDRLVLGSIAGGATLGILIPPSINLIIYGALTETSIGQLFLAGFIPGLVLAVLFMLVIVVISLLWPAITGDIPDLPPLLDRVAALVHLIPPLAIFGLVMGGILFGWATPTESAALGVLFTLVVAAVYGKLSIRMLHEAFLSTVRS